MDRQGQPSVGGLVLLQVKKDRSNRHKEVLDQMNLRIMEAEAKVDEIHYELWNEADDYCNEVWEFSAKVLPDIKRCYKLDDNATLPFNKLDSKENANTARIREIKEEIKQLQLKFDRIDPQTEKVKSVEENLRERQLFSKKDPELLRLQREAVVNANLLDALNKQMQTKKSSPPVTIPLVEADTKENVNDQSREAVIKRIQEHARSVAAIKSSKPSSFATPPAKTPKGKQGNKIDGYLVPYTTNFTMTRVSTPPTLQPQLNNRIVQQSGSTRPLRKFVYKKPSGILKKYIHGDQDK